VRTQQVRTDIAYGRYFVRLADTGDAPQMPPGILQEAFAPGNGLVATWTGGAVLITGAHSGVMTVELEAWDAAPPAATAEWEDIVKTTYDSRTGVVYLLDVWGTGQPDPSSLLTLAAGPQRYQVRAHARGRAAARGIQGWAEHVESMLVQFWPD
jgi:hypothetical protein